MDRKTAIQQAKSYCVYYGSGDEEQLVNYDIAIVEPSGHRQEDVDKLRESGVLVVAYVSVMEIRLDDALIPLLHEGDWLRDGDGRIIGNEAFATRLLDLTSRRWQGLLHHRMGQLLMKNRYDGLFLDTIGDVEWKSLPSAVREIQFQAAVETVRELRRDFPDHLLIQNNGLERLIDMTSAWVDGVCWENPLFFKPHLEWARLMAQRLSEIGRLHGTKVLLLLEAGENAELSMPACARLADAEGWLIYRAEKDYF